MGPPDADDDLTHPSRKLTLYQLLYEGTGNPVDPKTLRSSAPRRREEKLVSLFKQMPEGDKQLILALSRRVVEMQGENE